MDHGSHGQMDMSKMDHGSDQPVNMANMNHSQHQMPQGKAPVTPMQKQRWIIAHMKNGHVENGS